MLLSRVVKGCMAERQDSGQDRWQIYYVLHVAHWEGSRGDKSPIGDATLDGVPAPGVTLSFSLLCLRTLHVLDPQPGSGNNRMGLSVSLPLGLQIGHIHTKHAAAAFAASHSPPTGHASTIHQVPYG